MVDREGMQAAGLQRRGEAHGGAMAGPVVLAGTAMQGMGRHDECIYMKAHDTASAMRTPVEAKRGRSRAATQQCDSGSPARVRRHDATHREGERAHRRHQRAPRVAAEHVRGLTKAE